jgi:hypothetical protein
MGAGCADGAGGGVWASAVATRAFAGVVSSMLGVLDGILMTLSCFRMTANSTMTAATKIISIIFHLIMLGSAPYPFIRGASIFSFSLRVPLLAEVNWFRTFRNLEREPCKYKAIYI